VILGAGELALPDFCVGQAFLGIAEFARITIRLNIAHARRILIA
jgi:hypothetical protein